MRLEDKDRIIKYLELKTVQLNGCWLYHSVSRAEDGYKRVMIEGREIGVHRLSAYLFLGLDLDDNEQQANHKRECTSKACWNPEHLYIGTQKENIQDCVDTGRHRNSRKTHCAMGHLLTKSPTAGQRQCRICKNRKTIEKRRNDRLLKATKGKNG